VAEADGASARVADSSEMTAPISTATSYAVVWDEEGRPTATGKLVLDADAAVVSGTAGGRQLCSDRLAYAEIAGIRIGRTRDERLGGYPTLIVERHNRTLVRIGVFGAGLLTELASLLTALAA